MVNLSTFMVVATAMLLGVQALDKNTAELIKKELIDAKIIPDGKLSLYISSYLTLTFLFI
jgi:hypothetical protein